MSCCMCESKEARKDAFETARLGIPPVIVDRVMRGLPVSTDFDPKVRELRLVWARYHQDLRN